jgi:hypothetical protein
MVHNRWKPSSRSSVLVPITTNGVKLTNASISNVLSSEVRHRYCEALAIQINQRTRNWKNACALVTVYLVRPRNTRQSSKQECGGTENH